MNMNASGRGNGRCWGRGYDRMAYQGHGYGTPYACGPYGAPYGCGAPCVAPYAPVVPMAPVAPIAPQAPMAVSFPGVTPEMRA